MNGGSAGTAEFVARNGLQLSLPKDTFVLSKRLSALRPYRTLGFSGADEIILNDHNQRLNPKLWDGCGQCAS